MLLNLTNKYAVQARDVSDYGGIYCNSSEGPSFGLDELVTKEPFLGDGKLRSDVGNSGYKIPGNKDDINPLIGEKIDDKKRSFGTLLELEVWHINFLP